MNQFWDNDSDYAHDEVGQCERCGSSFDMWNQFGIEYKWCPTCRRKQREAKANGVPLEPITPRKPLDDDVYTF